MHPSPLYLAQLQAALNASAPAPNASFQPPEPVASMPVPPPPMESPAPFGPPLPPTSSGPDGPANMPNGIVYGKPPPPPRDDGEASPAASPPPDVGPGPAPAAPPRQGFEFAPLSGGGVIPAHEVDIRGPSLTAAQGRANSATGGAIQAGGERGAAVAQYAYDQALEQERAARARQAAVEQAAAEQAEELAQRQADFDQSARQLSKMSVDPDRFWSTRSTGQKIAAMVSITLGGFLQGARGGSNPGMDAINTLIDRDVRAQELNYHLARDANEAQKTAFGMAMQKYQQADAARAMARVASLDAIGAQVAQQRALEVGSNAASNADMLLAQLEQMRANQIAAGVKFVLPTQAPRMFLGEDGLRYTEAEMKAISKEHRGYEQDRQKIGLQTAGDVMKEGAKAQVEAGKQMQGRTTVPSMLVGGVKLPEYAAATGEEGKADREARQVGADLVAQIDKLLELRKQQGGLGRAGSKAVPFSTKWENDADTLAGSIAVKWSKMNKLGTYDAGVERLIQKVVGDASGVSGASDDKLQELRGMMIQTLDKARESQTGQNFSQPKSLKLYGGE